MPLQILLATLLALVTLGTQLPGNEAHQQEVMIMSGNQCAAEVIKSDSSEIIVITTLKRRSHSVTIMGVRQEGNATPFIPTTTAWRINELNKHHKRNITARAA